LMPYRMLQGNHEHRTLTRRSLAGAADFDLFRLPLHQIHGHTSPFFEGKERRSPVIPLQE
jgi:hypothetical protein